MAKANQMSRLKKIQKMYSPKGSKLLLFTGISVFVFNTHIYLQPTRRRVTQKYSLEALIFLRFCLYPTTAQPLTIAEIRAPSLLWDSVHPRTDLCNAESDLTDVL